jgi:hypothetical protein
MGNALPRPLEASGVAFAIDAEVGMVSALDQVVSSLVTIRAPRLDRERLVQVIFMPRLLIGFGDDCTDCLG